LIRWVQLSITYRKDIMDLQHGIGVVIIISFIESTVWASDYTNYNFTGQNSDVVNIIGALFTSSKLTVIRTLMLVVAIGYTITRPFMTVQYRAAIATLSILFFIVEATNQYIDVSKTAGIPVAELFQYAALAMLLLLNTAYFGWAGYEMFHTFLKLEQTEGEKFVMYKRLGVLLILSLILSIMILVAQLIITSMDAADDHFRVWWLWEGYWEFIYAACIIFVAWVWRPTENNLRYAYSEVGRGDDEDMDHAVPLEDIDDEKDEKEEKKPKKDESSISVSSDDSAEGKNKDKSTSTTTTTMTTNLDEEDLSD